jgi:hypothetical protein
VLGLLAAALLLAACGDDEQPVPPTDAPATADVVAPTADAVPAATDTAVVESPLATAEQPAALSPTTAPEQAPITEAVDAQPVVTSTAGSAEAGFAPLEADEVTDCAIESNLDLVGYPDLEQRMGCPVAEAQFDPIGINEFGDLPPYDRFMLWFSHEKQIYVLYPGGAYAAYPDTWVEDVDPTFSCNPLGGEADSPPLPRRGFGKLWCSDPAIQEAMGTVPREERLCQHAVLQQFEAGRLLACFEDATIRYFRLLDDGAWDLVAQ